MINLKYISVLLFMLFVTGCLNEVKKNKVIKTNQTSKNSKEAKFAIKTFNPKKLSLNDSIEIMVQNFYGVAQPDALSMAKKFIAEHETELQQRILSMLKASNDPQEKTELIFVLRKIKLNDELREVLFNIAKDTKISKEKNHLEAISNSEKTKYMAIDFLYKDLKKGNLKSKEYLTNLIKINNFSEKQKIVNMLLKLDGKNRRSTQMKLKKILPKNEHYLLFRK